MIFDLQKASMWKRISACIFDVILLGILIIGIAFLLSSAFNYDGYSEQLNNAYAKYETQYGIEFELTEEQFTSMTEEDAAVYEAAYTALTQDHDAMYAYNMVVNLTMLVITISVLLGFLALEFAVPLMLGNGQTLGKKIFGIALMRTSGIQINAVSLFIRTVLGKYTIETMVPILIIMLIFWGTLGPIGTVILGLILLLQVIFLITTRTNSAIHDLLADTVAVDISSQMIFSSEEALIAYKKKAAAEKASRQPY